MSAADTDSFSVPVRYRDLIPETLSRDARTILARAIALGDWSITDRPLDIHTSRTGLSPEEARVALSEIACMELPAGVKTCGKVTARIVEETTKHIGDLVTRTWRQSPGSVATQP